MKTEKQSWKKQTVEEIERKLEEYKEMAKWFNLPTPDSPGHFFDIGKKYLIRTVTMIQLGRLVAVGDKELVMEDASWVADTGRFNQFLTEHKTANMEIEPFPSKIIIGRGAIIDAVEWTGDLPKKVA